MVTSTQIKGLQRLLPADSRLPEIKGLRRFLETLLDVVVCGQIRYSRGFGQVVVNTFFL